MSIMTIKRKTITVEEGAAALDISRSLAYAAVRRGEIPSIKIGNRTLIPRTKFEEKFGIEIGEAA